MYKTNHYILIMSNKKPNQEDYRITHYKILKCKLYI